MSNSKKYVIDKQINLNPINSPYQLNLHSLSHHQPEHPIRTCIIRAYSIGYAIQLLPSILKLLIINTIKLTPSSLISIQPKTTILHLSKLILRPLRPNGLATASAIAIGGASFLDSKLYHHIETLIRLVRFPHQKLNQLINPNEPSSSKLSTPSPTETCFNAPLSHIEQMATAILSTFSSASLSSLLAIVLLQSKHTSTVLAQGPLHPTMTPYPPITRSDPSQLFKHESLSRQNLQSPTLDFTLFFTVRALDTLCRSIYDNFSPNYLSFLSKCTDTLLFQLCCWRIMWCWFYKPNKLPESYVKWIATLAEMDQRLLQLIRLAKGGKYVYGTRPESDHIRDLGRSIAIHMGKPPQDGDPEFINQLSCRIVHGTLGNSESCTTNVIRRWFKAWKTSLGIYFPVFTVPVLLFQRKKMINSPLKTIFRILINSSRSAAFLSSFVGLTWTGVCFGRSKILQDFLNKLIKMRSNKTRGGVSCGINFNKLITTTYLDGTIAPQLGSFLAGFSILIENKKRRGEMALYVATRALCATIDEILPKWLRYQIKINRWVSIWVERITFSISFGIITCAMVHHPNYVRGIVKGILKYVIGSNWPKYPKSIPSVPAKPVETDPGQHESNNRIEN